MTAPNRPFISIVSGLPRSGTSLMMQMLHAGGLPAMTDEVRSPDDDNPRGYFEFERVKQLKSDQSWLPDAVGKVVKMVHLLLMGLPDGFEYRVVLMRRDLDEVIRSQSIMLQRSGKAGAAMPAERLRDVYAKQLTAVRTWLEARSHFRVLEVAYAQLVANPAETAAVIDRFLGGGLDQDRMAAAVDPALYRNRSPA